MAIISNVKGNPEVDAFQRSRVSNPQTLFDSKQIFDALPLVWDDSEVSGTGTGSTYSKPHARSRLSVDTNAGKRVRQTFERFNYQPGKSQEIILTGVLGAGAVGITQAIGYFDDDNGLFFQCKDAVVSVVRRSGVTGSPVDNTVNQADWNMDTMDGNGPSGITLIPSNTQIFFMDFEWLGVGRARFGFFLDGKLTYVHEFRNTNNLDVVYMSTPNLPIRYSIENDGNGPATFLDHLCSAVVSEGGQQHEGVIHQQSTAGAHVDMATENVLYAIVGIRLKSTHLAMTIELLKVAVTLQTQSKDIEWVLIFNPTIAGTPSWVNKTNSAIQYFLGAEAHTITGGTNIDSGYVATGAGASASSADDDSPDNALRLGSTIAGVQQTIVLCARPINGATAVDVEGGITWRELN